MSSDVKWQAELIDELRSLEPSSNASSFAVAPLLSRRFALPAAALPTPADVPADQPIERSIALLEEHFHRHDAYDTCLERFNQHAAARLHRLLQSDGDARNVEIAHFFTYLFRILQFPESDLLVGQAPTTAGTVDIVHRQKAALQCIASLSTYSDELVQLLLVFDVPATVAERAIGYASCSSSRAAALHCLARLICRRSCLLHFLEEGTYSRLAEYFLRSDAAWCDITAAAFAPIQSKVCMFLACWRLQKLALSKSGGGNDDKWNHAAIDYTTRAARSLTQALATKAPVTIANNSNCRIVFQQCRTLDSIAIIIRLVFCHYIRFLCFRNTHCITRKQGHSA